MSTESKQTLEIPCANPNCKKTFVVEIANAEILNSLSISAVVWAHPDIQNCPFCGTAYQMRVLKVEAPTIRFDPVRAKSDANIIVPPAGMQLPPAPGRN